ncbi:MAG: protein-L-isoaspartate(D-aspartate) O-methyltransferase [Chloroflexi bacterium]|nr:protein-L-isoaspartate(D-aspartate) O-methyltransferase [Chloroflexota bacterium]
MRWPRFSRPRDGAFGRAPEGADAQDPRDPAVARARMVADQLRARGIDDDDVLAAFERVERHRFVTDDDPYGDHALPVGSGQTISQPYVVAVMTDAVRPDDGWHDARMLEIGTGSGYQAAILAELGARVVSIERHEELATAARQHLADTGYADRVEVIVGDGSAGWPAEAPYRAILVTAGGPSIPEPLLDQLEPDGGRLVMPVGEREHQALTLVERRGDERSHRDLGPVVFVPLIGEHGHSAR